MIAETNKHGLSRTIPGPVERAIRQACGFGCVVCGNIIIDYDHVDPEFADAREHDPECMALLCPLCHTKKTRRIFSKDDIKSARANPVCMQRGYSSEFITVGQRVPRIVFAGMTIEECPVPVKVGGLPVIQIEQAEVEGSPLRLSANFYNAEGNQSLVIERNEWQVLEAANWDVEAEGPAITVRQKARHITLKLSAQPPDLLIVERMDMRVQDWIIQGGRDKLLLGKTLGRLNNLTGAVASNCDVGLELS